VWLRIRGNSQEATHASATVTPTALPLAPGASLARPATLPTPWIPWLRSRRAPLFRRRLSRRPFPRPPLRERLFRVTAPSRPWRSLRRRRAQRAQRAPCVHP
jgi:hypothetical protein